MRALIVTNMYPTSANPHGGPFIAAQVESLRALGVDVEVWHVERLEQGRSAYRGLSKETRRQVAAHEPDLVHVQYGGVLADRVSRAVSDHPVLVSFCGDDLLGSPGGGVVDYVAGRVNILASRAAARRAAGIVVKSRNLFDALPRWIDRERVWILPNGVDLSRFRPLDRQTCQQELGWDPARRHVLFPAPPGRTEKRFPLAQAAVAGLDGAARAELHTLAGVEHEQVPVWINAADVVLLTSSREGSPNAVKEALACNVPVVSVDVGDVRERLDGIAGCYLADATPEDLARQLQRALEGPGRVKAEARMSELAVDRVAQDLRGIYETLLA
jgi:teichuronic acid biosynthesis glycosyltransferase TuaC